jgi:hypothetical protein
MANIWDCPLCGQVVEIGSRPPNYFETCRLRDRMIGDECLAYRDLRGAEKILKEKSDD